MRSLLPARQLCAPNSVRPPTAFCPPAVPVIMSGCMPPPARAREFVEHYVACKALAPASTSAGILLPKFPPPKAQRPQPVRFIRHPLSPRTQQSMTNSVGYIVCPLARSATCLVKHGLPAVNAPDPERMPAPNTANSTMHLTSLLETTSGAERSTQHEHTQLAFGGQQCRNTSTVEVSDPLLHSISDTRRHQRALHLSQRSKRRKNMGPEGMSRRL
jgi:hypothetical protein